MFYLVGALVGVLPVLGFLDGWFLWFVFTVYGGSFWYVVHLRFNVGVCSLAVLVVTDVLWVILMAFTFSRLFRGG